MMLHLNYLYLSVFNVRRIDSAEAARLPLEEKKKKKRVSEYFTKEAYYKKFSLICKTQSSVWEAEVLGKSLIRYFGFLQLPAV